MSSDTLEAVIFCVCVVATAIITIWRRRRKVVYILDYQAGVRFDGSRCKVLPSGIYLSNPNRAPITIIDMRPRQFIFERQFYKDALPSNFLMSIAGEFHVCNAELALTTFKNLFDESIAMIGEGLHTITSRSIVEAGTERKAELASTLISELNRELQPRGVEVRRIEITELVIQQPRFNIPAITN